MDRWFGAWEPLDPAMVGRLLDGFDCPWWIAGGWSLEAFTGLPRAHEDLDLCLFGRDAVAFRDFLGEEWTMWNVDDGWFHAFDDTLTSVSPTSQLWVRRDAASPWVLDVLLNRDDDGRWTNKRDPTHVEDLADVTWVAPDGLRYARPEVTLMFKAALRRDKDIRDAEQVLPLLDEPARRWLRETVARFDPGHAWGG